MNVSEYRDTISELGNTFRSLQSAATPQERKLEAGRVQRAISRLALAQCKTAKVADKERAQLLCATAQSFLEENSLEQGEPRPGPWKTEFLDEHHRHPIRVVDANGDDVAIVQYGGDTSRAEAEANARLLAASHELLAACEVALGDLEFSSIGNDPDTLRRLRSTIEKAKLG